MVSAKLPPSSADAVAALIDAVRRAFPECRIDSIKTDGGITRFKVDGRDAKESGWVSAGWSHGVLFAKFGSWKYSSEQFSFRSGDYDRLAPDEKKAVDSAIRAQAVHLGKERESRAREAQRKVPFILRKQKAAKDCPLHPYLERKGLTPCKGMMQGVHDGQNKLYIPQYWGKERELVSFQTINEKGEKRHMAGGRKGFFIIGDDDERPYCLAEGVATALSVHLATGLQCFCAFDADNVPKVAGLLRSTFPDRLLVVCADDDYLLKDSRGRKSNKGIKTARMTVSRYGGVVAVPVFLEHEGRTDFDDMRQEQGLDAVKACIDQAVAAYQARPSSPAASAAMVDGGDGVPAVPSDDNDLVDEQQIGTLCFRLKHRGLFCKDLTQDGDAPDAQISSFVQVLGLIRDVNSLGWGRVVSVRDADDKAHVLIIPASAFAGNGDEWRKMLLDAGVTGFAHNANNRKQLSQYLQSYRTDKRVRSVDRVGWFHGAYVKADCTIGQPDEEVIFRNDEAEYQPWLSAGTLQEWIDNVSLPCAGNSRLVFSLSVAFAAPLLEMSGQENCCFHLLGGSSQGKSSALKIASSVYSAPDKYMRSWRATDNGLEAVASMHNDGLLALDEFSMIDAKAILRGIGYILINGIGKTRATKGGAGREVKKWRVMVLSSGEESLASKAEKEGMRINAGEEVRFLSIESAGQFGMLETVSSSEEAGALIKRLNEAIRRYHGTAGSSLIQKVIENRPDIEAGLKDWIEGFRRLIYPSDKSAQIRRVAYSFALVVAGGEIATKYGLTGWQAGEALEAGKKCFAAFLASFGEMNREEKRILDHVASVFVRHGSARFEDLATDKSRPIIERIGWKLFSDAGVDGLSVQERYYYVRPQQFRAEFCNGMPVRQVADVLAKYDFIVKDEQGRNSVLVAGRSVKAKIQILSPSFNPKKAVRCYVFDADVIDAYGSDD